MSMYHMLFSHNPLGPAYLATLGLSPSTVGRYRDAFLRKTDANEVQITILTRNGGGNRETYEEVTESLRKHPLYVTDYDEEFDSTYATYVFKVPEEYEPKLRELAERQDQTVDPMARYKLLLEKLQSGNDNDPEVQKALEAGKKILTPVFEQMGIEVPDDKKGH